MRSTRSLLSWALPLLVVACHAPEPKAPEPMSPSATSASADAPAAEPEGMASPRPGQYPAAPNGQMWPSFAEPPASDAPGLVAQLDRAEQAVGLALLLPPQPTGTPEPPSTPLGASPADAAPARKSEPPRSSDRCAIACAALASMKRSTEHLCELVGSTDAACDAARGRVQRAAERVTNACPACAAE